MKRSTFLKAILSSSVLSAITHGTKSALNGWTETQTNGEDAERLLKFMTLTSHHPGLVRQFERVYPQCKASTWTELYEFNRIRMEDTCKFLTVVGVHVELKQVTFLRLSKNGNSSELLWSSPGANGSNWGGPNGIIPLDLNPKYVQDRIRLVDMRSSNSLFFRYEVDPIGIV